MKFLKGYPLRQQPQTGGLQEEQEGKVSEPLFFVPEAFVESSFS